MTTGDKIRAARQSAGLTQKKLSELTGIAEPTIRKYESNRLHPKIETLQKLAAPLGVLYLDLYGDDETDLIKTGIDLGKNTAQTAGNILTRMQVVAEFQEQGYTFEPKERRLVCAYNKINDVGRAQILQLTEGMAEMPRFMLEPPEGTDTTPPGEKPSEGG